MYVVRTVHRVGYHTVQGMATVQHSGLTPYPMGGGCVPVYGGIPYCTLYGCGTLYCSGTVYDTVPYTVSPCMQYTVGHCVCRVSTTMQYGRYPVWYSVGHHTVQGTG